MITGIGENVNNQMRRVPGGMLSMNYHHPALNPFSFLLLVSFADLGLTALGKTGKINLLFSSCPCSSAG
jgi:hypothetical protein